MENFWQGRRVFVTGATGLVGSWLVKSLVQSRAYVVALVRDSDPKSEFFRSGIYHDTSVICGALEDYLSLERAINENDIDTVFHLAAQPIVHIAHRSPLQTFEANIRGTYNLLEACRVHQPIVQRVVVASSDKAYGTQPVLPYTEDMPLQGEYPYEVSKSCADLIAHTYANAYNLPVAIARCGNIYGGGDLNWSRIIPDTIRCFLRGEPITLRSDGTFVRDYIYVKDVVNAYMRLAEQTHVLEIRGEAFNFAPGKPFTVREIVECLQRLLHCESLTPIIQNSARGEIQSQYLNSSKAEQLLQWVPQYSLEDGLTETIEWYRAYFDSNHLN